MNYQFDPHASQELNSAVAYYDNLDPALADSFCTEVQRTISLIRRLPRAWPHVTVNASRCIVKGFPFGIVYQLRGSNIVVIAVMHLSRRPEYWRDREISI
jgi:toxin ParE2